MKSVFLVVRCSCLRPLFPLRSFFPLYISLLLPVLYFFLLTNSLAATHRSFLVLSLYLWGNLSCQRIVSLYLPSLSLCSCKIHIDLQCDEVDFSSSLSFSLSFLLSLPLLSQVHSMYRFAFIRLLSSSSFHLPFRTIKNLWMNQPLRGAGEEGEKEARDAHTSDPWKKFIYKCKTHTEREFNVKSEIQCCEKYTAREGSE